MLLPLTLRPATATTTDVVALGEASLDFVAVVDGPVEAGAKSALADFRVLPGGQAATAAVACARQGWRARFVGVLGQDLWAERVLSALAADAVEAVVLRRVGVASRTAIILVDGATGERTVLEHRSPSLDREPFERDPAVVTAGRVLMVDDTDAEAAVDAARAARAAGVATVVDLDAPGDEADLLLREIDIMIVAASFIASLGDGHAMGEGLRRLAATYRPAVAIVTLGEEGSLAVCGGHEIYTPARRVAVVDTTGAGDAFRAGFVSAWLATPDRPDLARVLQWATVTAALNCRGLGAQAGLPSRFEVEACL